MQQIYFATKKVETTSSFTLLHNTTDNQRFYVNTWGHKVNYNNKSHNVFFKQILLITHPKTTFYRCRQLNFKLSHRAHY